MSIGEVLGGLRVVGRWMGLKGWWDIGGEVVSAVVSMKPRCMHLRKD